MLTMDRYRDGKERIPSDLKLERCSGGYMLTIQDHDTGLQKSFPLQRLSDLVVTAEAALLNPDVPWRAFKSYKNKAGLKKFDKKNA